MSIYIKKIKNFFLKNEQKIVLFVGFCLISAISFEFGVLQGQKWQQKPLVIEKPSDTPQQGVGGQNEAPSTPSNSSQAIGQAKTPERYNLKASSYPCAYVGSKSSNKFYLPTCSYAKRIKPENVVCFKTAQEAIGQGRMESKCN